MRTLIFVFLLAAAACGRSGPQGYSAADQLAFQQSCATSARTSAGPNVPQQTLVHYCNCVWGRVSTELSHEEFAAFSALPPAQRASSPTGRSLAEYAQSCLASAPKGT